MNIFYAFFNLLKDFWNLLEEFFQHMRPELIQDLNINDDSIKPE
jgi:hypothetical protein